MNNIFVEHTLHEKCRYVVCVVERLGQVNIYISKSEFERITKGLGLEAQEADGLGNVYYVDPKKKK